jgi:RNA polymerase sigma factor (sigma-70 family)
VRSHYPGESDNQKIDTLLAVVLSSPEVGVLPIGSGVPDLLALREKLLLDYEEVAYDILDSEELDVDAQMSALAELLYTEPTQEASEERRRLQEAVSYALSTLTPREERVLQLRFFSQSFDQEKSMSSDRDGQTLDEIGDHLHISTERVRQIEAKALRKLRHPARSKTLRKFLG